MEVFGLAIIHGIAQSEAHKEHTTSVGPDIIVYEFIFMSPFNDLNFHPEKVNISAAMDDYTMLKRSEDWAIPDMPRIEFKLGESEQLRCLQRGIRQVEMIIYCFRQSQFEVEGEQRQYNAMRILQKQSMPAREDSDDEETQEITMSNKQYMTFTVVTEWLQHIKSRSVFSPRCKSSTSDALEGTILGLFLFKASNCYCRSWQRTSSFANSLIEHQAGHCRVWLNALRKKLTDKISHPISGM